MNQQQAQEILPFVQALADGMPIQFRNDSGDWIDVDQAFLQYGPSRYRVKPEPPPEPPPYLFAAISELGSIGDLHFHKEDAEWDARSFDYVRAATFIRWDLVPEPLRLHVAVFEDAPPHNPRGYGYITREAAVSGFFSRCSRIIEMVEVMPESRKVHVEFTAPAFSNPEARIRATLNSVLYREVPVA
jgi:hypothetical protein